jgi:hypothetical protein
MRKGYRQYLGRKFSERYDALVREGMGENSKAEKEAGKRGKGKQLLLERFEGYKGAYLKFSRDFRVSFDNNQTERDFKVHIPSLLISCQLNSYIFPFEYILPRYYNSLYYNELANT